MEQNIEQMRKISSSNKVVKKHEEMNLINCHELFNIIHREVPQQFRGNFLIYEFFQPEKEKTFQNLINIPNNQDIEKMIDENNFSLLDIQNLLPQDKQQLFKRKKRCFNIIIPFQKNDKFSAVLQYKYFNMNPEELPMDTTEFQEFLNGILQNNPDLLKDDSYIQSQRAFNFYLQLKKEKVTEVLFLYESMEELVLTYPFMIEHLQRIQDSPNYPNEIIPGQMYLGNVFHASNSDIIKRLGITHVLNMTENIDNFFQSQGELQYMQNKIQDLDHSEIGTFFQKSYQFIDGCLKVEQPDDLEVLLKSPNKLMTMYSNHWQFEQKEQKEESTKSPGKILIHCAQGKSRSATIVIMYLMKKFHWKFDQAYKFLKQKRDYIEPNYGFQEKLKQFEKCGNDFEKFMEDSPIENE